MAMTGILTKKNHRHDSTWVKKPPTNGPIAEPTPPTAPNRPIPTERCSGGKALLTIDSPSANSIAEPTPCTARAAISCHSAWATPLAMEATPNRTSPASMTLRRPSRSPSRPTATSGPAMPSMKAFTVQASDVVELCRSRPIAGNATTMP
jgi:hypothetical protein